MHEEMHITQMQFMNTGAREIVSFLDTTLWGSVATYPSAGGRRETRGMRVPGKEYARSRHQRLFEENVGKTGKDAIYELLSEGFGSFIYARGRY